MYKRTHREQPQESNFGTFQDRLELVRGKYDVIEALEQAKAIVLVVENTDGTKKVIEIGKTPEEFDPRKNGKMLEGANRSQGDLDVDYLMIVHSAEGDVTGNRYVSREEISGLKVGVNDSDVEFAPRNNGDGSGTQLRIAGMIEQVVAYE